MTRRMTQATRARVSRVVDAASRGNFRRKMTRQRARGRAFVSASAAKRASGVKPSERSYVIEPFHAILGSRKARRALHHRDFEEMQRVDRDGGGGVEALERALERERRAHAQMATELEAAEKAYASDAEVRAMKSKKLRLKDAMAALERDLVRAKAADEILGAGAYGRIFKAKDATTSESVAVKVVDVADEDALEAEFSLLRTLSAADSRCFPKPLWCGRQTVMGGKARVMVMNLLGESLEQISQRVTMGTGFSRCTTARVAKRLFTALEACHRNGVVHGDVKPDNLLTEIHRGGDARRTGIVLVDFGEAIRFDDAYVARLDEDVSRDDWRGTLLFSSQNVDTGAKMAPRDDLESSIYTLAYLRTGRLPWSRALDTDEVDVRELAKAKRVVDSGAALLTPFGVDKGRVPDDYEDDVDFFERVLSHARSLRPADAPDYDFLQRSVAEWRDGSNEPYEWERDP